MQLAWTQRDEIAKALIKAYPDADRLALDVDGVAALIRALPNFADKPEPPRAAYVEAILWTWMRLAEDETLRAPANEGG